MAIDALAHLERLDLLNLFHSRNVAMAGRANSRGPGVHTARRARHDSGVLGEETNMGFMHEPDVVGETVDAAPVNRRWTIEFFYRLPGRLEFLDFLCRLAQRVCQICGVAEEYQLGIIGRTDNLVAGGAEAHRRNARVCLRCDRAVTERAVHAQAVHGRAIRGDAVELPDRRVDSMWEVDRLVERLLKAKDRDRLTEPPGDDERCKNADNRHDTEAADSQYRYEQFR